MKIKLRWTKDSIAEAWRTKGASWEILVAGSGTIWKAHFWRKYRGDLLGFSLHRYKTARTARRGAENLVASFVKGLE